MGKCKFQSSWLERDDSEGHLVKEWGKRCSDSELMCIVCDKSINVSKGFQAIAQHASMLKHRQNFKIKQASNQLHLTVSPPSCSSAPSSSSGGTVLLYNNRDRTTAAELMWCLKCVASDYSFSSCNGLQETFKVMFGDSVLQDFSLGNNKAHYLVSDALGPYFKKLQMQDMVGSYFTLLYDETTNSSGMKELQTGVRYWSNTQNKIVFSHLETFYIGTATSSVIVEKLNDALNSYMLPLSNLLMLGSDGPNVNKSVARNFNDTCVLNKRKPLIDIGTCNIHTIHNAFLKGISEFGEDVSELVLDIHNFFDGWPARRSDFMEMQTSLKLPKHNFVKHCSSRWLTLCSAAKRLQEQWTAVRKYFLSYIPQKKPKLMETPRYLKIVRQVKKPTIKAQILFVISSATLFNSVTEFFQRNEPLIHLLHSRLELLVTTLLGRICTTDCLKNLKLDCVEDVFCTHNLLPINDIVVGDEVRNALNGTSEKERSLFFLGVQKHFTESIKHIVKKSSLGSALLKSLSCLNPDKRCLPESYHSLLEISRAMPCDVPNDLLLDEWKLLQREEETSTACVSVDVYWTQFMELKNVCGNGPKYPNVTKIVKAALSLSHGSADVERGFSSSCRTLTTDRASMSERTLNAIMTVKSALKKYDNKPYLVPITDELLRMGRVAYKSYNAYLEEKERREKKKLLEEQKDLERKAEEKEQLEKLKTQKRTIEEDEQKLKKCRKEYEEIEGSGLTLLDEANERLIKALQKRDFKEVALAQAMIEGAKKVQVQAAETKRVHQTLTTSIEKKKTKLIKDFFQQSLKKKD